MLTVGELLARIRFDDSEMEEGEERARRRFSGLGDHMRTAGLAAGVAGGAMLAQGLSDALDMETANAKLTASLGATGEEAAAIGRASGAVYASGWGESLDDVNTALASTVSAFRGVEDMSEAGMQQSTKSALALADVLEVDVGEAATAAGALVKQGLVDDSVEAFNTMTAAAQTLPKSMVADLPAVITEYGSHLKRIGLDAQTSFGLMSQYVAAGGRDIDQAADVLHEFGRITTEETDRAAEGFKGLGLDSKQMLTDLGKGGPQAKAALQATLDALRGIEDPAKRAQLQVALFGDMAGESVDALIAMDPASATAGTALDDTSGAAARLTEQLGGTTAQSLESLKRQFSQGLAGAISQALPYIQTATEWLGENADLVKTIAIPALIALGLGALVMGGQVAAGWIAAMGPVGWAAMAIAAAVALIIMHWDTIKNAAAAVWSAIQSAWGAVANWFSGLPGMFSGWFSSAGSWLSSAGQSIISGLWSGVKAIWDNTVVLFFVDIPKKIFGWFASAGSWLVDSGRNILVGLGTGILGFWAGSVVPFFTGLPGRIVGFFVGAGSLLLGIGRDIISGLLGGIQGMWGTANTWLSQIGRFIGGHFGNAGRWLYDAGKAILRGLWDGMKAMWGEVSGWVGSLGGKIKNLKGPLPQDKIMLTQEGDAIIGGLLAGMEGRWGDVETWLSGAAGRIQTPMLSASLASAPVRGGDGGAMPVFAPQITFSGPVYADSSGIERLSSELLPSMQRHWRDYDRNNT